MPLPAYLGVVMAFAFAAVVLIAIRRRRTDAFTSAKPPAKPRSFPELVGMRAVVAKTASKDLAAVSFVVDGQGSLAASPVVPWAGRPVQNVLPRFQVMFGKPYVLTSTQDVAVPDKVVLVHNPTTHRVIKVHIPKRWSIRPERLAVPAKTRVIVNPSNAAGARGLVLTTDSNNIIRSATHNP